MSKKVFKLHVGEMDEVRYAELDEIEAVNESD